jgi:hypothetical protein
MSKKQTTIESLAIMVAKGFDDIKEQIHSTDEASEERTSDLEEHIKDGFSHVNARLSTIEGDIAEIRKHFVYRDEFEDLMGRVKYLELKLGIESGK